MSSPCLKQAFVEPRNDTMWSGARIVQPEMMCCESKQKNVCCLLRAQAGPTLSFVLMKLRTLCAQKALNTLQLVGYFC